MQVVGSTRKDELDLCGLNFNHLHNLKERRFDNRR